MILPPERTASIACSKRAVAGQALLGAAAGALEHDVGADSLGQIADRGHDVALRRVQGMVGPQLARHGAGLVAHVDRDDQSGAAGPGNLHALQAHAPLPQHDDRVADRESGPFRPRPRCR